MKMFIEVLLVTVAVIALVYLSFHFVQNVSAPTKQSSLNSVCIGENCFQVELAKTAAEREKGLMYRTQLDKNKGMLFIFDKEGLYPFWMKNTLIPLDIIWIDNNGKVVSISQDVQPCTSLICPSVISSAQARYVLEVNAGICKEIGLKLGDELKIN